MTPPIIVTRPEDGGRRLTAALRERGFDALRLPAFDLGAAPRPAEVSRTLARLQEFDLAVFVSPAAVRATAAQYGAPWPQSTAIGVVGAATGQALRAWLPAAAGARVIAPGPSSDGQPPASGSEALWSALGAAGLRPRRVLLLRADSGRDWLLDRWRQAGVEATALAVYSRRLHAPDAGEIGWLERHRDRPSIASVITSSEAVDALTRLLAPWPAVCAALRVGPALASHPRIAARLRAARFGDVRETAPRAEAIAQHLARDDEGGV